MCVVLKIRKCYDYIYELTFIVSCLLVNKKNDLSEFVVGLKYKNYTVYWIKTKLWPKTWGLYQIVMKVYRCIPIVVSIWVQIPIFSCSAFSCSSRTCRGTFFFEVLPLLTSWRWLWQIPTAERGEKDLHNIPPAVECLGRKLSFGCVLIGFFEWSLQGRAVIFFNSTFSCLYYLSSQLSGLECLVCR